MSLIFAAAIREFSPDEATHLRPSSEAVRPTRDDPVPIRGLLEFATRHRRLDHDREGYVYLPLHEPTNAGLSGTYLLYADHPMNALHADGLLASTVVTAEGEAHDQYIAFATTAAGEEVLEQYVICETCGDVVDVRRGCVHAYVPMREAVDMSGGDR